MRMWAELQFSARHSYVILLFFIRIINACEYLIFILYTFISE